MRLGLDISQHQQTWDEIAERARFGERAGFDGVWLFDHFKPLYGDRTGPCLEGWTLLAALARETERVRLGTLVSGVTYRHPALLASEAVTVDHVSGGRVEFAVGAAWFEGEHRELGFEFPPAGERAARLEEAITVADLMMTTDGASFEGRYYRLKDASYNPKPVQKPRPPLWVGANGAKKMLPLAARVADVWHGSGSIADLRRKNRIIDEHAEKAGRDPKAVARATWLSLSEPWGEVRSRVDALAGLGFSYVVASWPSEGRGRLEEFVEKVMPEVMDATP